jgi:hypothetical protein
MSPRPDNRSGFVVKIVSGSKRDVKGAEIGLKQRPAHDLLDTIPLTIT